jgi:hypothetical protein
MEEIWRDFGAAATVRSQRLKSEVVQLDVEATEGM